MLIAPTRKRKRDQKDEHKTEETNFIIGQNKLKDDDEGVVVSTNKVPSYKPVKGSLILLSVCQKYQDKYVVCNHTRNKKAYMSATNGQIDNKQVGDFLYGVVVGTKSHQSDRSFISRNHRLQVTENLNIFNIFLTASKLAQNMQLQGVVESREDKGYVIDLHTKDKVKAFLSFKSYKGPELEDGQQISVILKKSKSKSQNIIK